MAITLTQNGVKTAVSLHPENTARKAVSLHIKGVTVPVRSLGGVELTLEQIRAQFQAHWTLTRKQSGNTTRPDKPDYNKSGRGPFANSYSDAIVKECKAILDSYGVRKLA